MPLPPGTSSTSADPESARFALSFMQVFVGVLYLQASLAKLLGGGLAWYTSGRTAWAFTVAFGSELGRRAADHPALFQVATLYTGLVELGFLPLLLLLPRLQPGLAAAAIAMHLGIYATMGISFWHLWVLYPALFILWNRR